MTKPISPNDIAETKFEQFPDAVFLAVNALLAERYTNGRARFNQDEVIDRIIGFNDKLERSEIFARGWLNFEEVYRDAGWEIEFDKPAYFEDYTAFWIFSRGKTA